jgi:WD40 repeat protein
VRLLKGADTEVRDLAFSPDGRAIAAGFDDYHGVYLWNLEGATPVPVRLSADGGYSRGGLLFSSDNRSLWWLRIDGRRAYNRDTREYTNQSFAIAGVTHGAFASADGSRVVSQHGLPDYCLIGWQFTDIGWARTWTVSIADLQVEKLTVSDDGRLLAMTARSALGEHKLDYPRRVEVWNGLTGKFVSSGDYPYNYAPILLFSPEAEQLVGMNDMTLLVWPVEGLGAPRLVRNDTRKDFTSIAFDPTGRRLYATSNDTTVQVFDTESWERVNRFTWQVGRLKAVAVSPDGMLAAAGGDKGDIVIWDVDV